VECLQVHLEDNYSLGAALAFLFRGVAGIG